MIARRIASTTSHGCESPLGAVVVTSGGTGALVIAVVGVPLPLSGADVVGGGSVVTTEFTGGTVVASPGSELPPAVVPLLPAGGVGSKRWVQPSPASQISGQACALCDCTWNTPSRKSPGVNPTATRDGM